jgi:hypothetical protein
MVKKSIIAVSGIVVVAILININDTKETEVNSLKGGNKQIEAQQERIEIEYSDLSSQDYNTTLAVKEEDPFVEARTTVQFSPYQIALINPDKPETIREDKRWTRLYGKIDERPFELRVPIALINDNNGNLELRVTNSTSGEVQTVAFEHVHMLSDEMQEHHISLDSSDLSAVVYDSKPRGVLP